MLTRLVAGMLVGCAALALAGAGQAQETAQQFPAGLTPGGLLRPNPPFIVVDPRTNKAFVPFQAPAPPPNDAPSPFNNPFPMSPNSQPSEGRALAPAPGGSAARVTEVPGQWVYSLQFVPGIGSASGTCQWQMAWMPGYTVTETAAGYYLSSRWVPRATVPCAYGWVAAPATFVPR
jgi:hypothetical protein